MNIEKDNLNDERFYLSMIKYAKYICEECCIDELKLMSNNKVIIYNLEKNSWNFNSKIVKKSVQL